MTDETEKGKVLRLVPTTEPSKADKDSLEGQEAACEALAQHLENVAHDIRNGLYGVPLGVTIISTDEEDPATVWSTFDNHLEIVGALVEGQQALL